ncbi:hypothetical protein K438DRAFT_1862039, partial [Mycena galopus ATCC 62051]
GGHLIFWGLSSSFALAPLFSLRVLPSSTPTYPLQWGNAGTPLLTRVPDGGGIFGNTYGFTGGGGAFGLEVAAAGWHYSRLLKN